MVLTVENFKIVACRQLAALDYLLISAYIFIHVLRIRVLSTRMKKKHALRYNVFTVHFMGPFFNSDSECYISF